MPLLRRRPLLRAAAVGGGAYAMGRHNANTQQREAYQDQRIDDLESQPPPAPPAAAPPSGGVSSDSIQRLEELGRLHDQGVLTDDEFAQQKARVLAG